MTISGTPTASGPFTYTVTLTGGCGVITATGTITVTPNNTVTLPQQQELMHRRYVSILQSPILPMQLQEPPEPQSLGYLQE